LSVTSENPERIRKLFPSDEVNPNGSVQVCLTKNGLKTRVTLDTYFPVNENDRPCFSRANGSELWVLILEKAWAKLHGSYERIIGGMAHETFRDVLGAPSFSYKSDEEDAFQKILEAD
jgi:calpain-15